MPITTEDPRNIHVSGYFRLSSAPLGTPLPTDVYIPEEGLTPANPNLDSAFVDHGYTTPDGSLFRVNKTFESIQVHQQQGSVRDIETEVLEEIQTVFREYNRETWQTAFGGGEFTENGGVTRYEPPRAGFIRERVFVLDSIDGESSLRVVVRRGMVSSGTESAFQRTNASDLPVTIRALIPGGGVRNFYALGRNVAGFETSGS